MDKLNDFRSSLFWRGLKKLQEVVIVVTAVVSTMIFVVEVILRYVLKIDFLGYDELVLLAIMWLYFIGGSYAMYEKKHISADMLQLILKGKDRQLEFARMIVGWVLFVIVLILAIWGVQFFQYAMGRPANTTVWRMPKLWAQSALTVGYILMAFYAFVYAIEDTLTFFQKKKPAETGGEEVLLND